MYTLNVNTVQYVNAWLKKISLSGLRLSNKSQSLQRLTF